MPFCNSCNLLNLYFGAFDIKPNCQIFTIIYEKCFTCDAEDSESEDESDPEDEESEELDEELPLEVDDEAEEEADREPGRFGGILTIFSNVQHSGLETHLMV